MGKKYIPRLREAVRDGDGDGDDGDSAGRGVVNDGGVVISMNGLWWLCITCHHHHRLVASEVDGVGVMVGYSIYGGVVGFELGHRESAQLVLKRDFLHSTTHLYAKHH